MDVWNAWGGKLSVALFQRFENADRVKEICDSVQLTNIDPHLLFSQLGEKLGLIPAITVEGAFANIYAQAKPNECEAILEPIQSILPMEK